MKVKKQKKFKKKKSVKNPIWKKPYIESKKMDIELIKRINAEK